MDLANKKEASRKKSLGELGELFALKALVDNKFDRIRNLNDDNMNETFADIYCEKDGEKYIISVKARNKFQKNEKLNTRYNLGKDVCYNLKGDGYPSDFETKSKPTLFLSMFKKD